MSEKAFVLIVEADSATAEAIADRLSRAGHACKIVPSAEDAAASIQQRPPDVVVADGRLATELNDANAFPGGDKPAADIVIIVMSPKADEPSVKAQLEANGANRSLAFVYKPVDVDVLCKKVDRAAGEAITSRQNRLMREQLQRAFNIGGIIGTSEVLAKELKRVSKLAKTKSTLLIVGESGTGKELIANLVHVSSPRNAKPFMPVNCAALSESLLESELFGHVKGAFTGALADRKGMLEAADGGTLFLDEIGDMPKTMQAKLLRTLESGEFMRVGSTDVRNVDVRFVAATHRDLRELIETGEFREDLFYRLHAHGAIRIPPLRQRREDIPLLIEHFIQRANDTHERSVTGVRPEALRKLTNYNWHGNVRELSHVVERMVLETENEILDVEDLPENISGSTDIVLAGAPSLAGLSMADVERIHILNTLKLTGGNREKAASILKIGARTLYRKLKDYGIT